MTDNPADSYAPEPTKEREAPAPAGRKKGGFFELRAGRFLHVDTIMAGIFMIGILGVMTDVLFRGIAALTFPWNRTRRG